MTDQEIAEGNNLIAEFMPDMTLKVPDNKEYRPYWQWKDPVGVGLKAYVCGSTRSTQEERLLSLAYHSNWNRLKPVVDEIFEYSIAHPAETERLRRTSIVVEILSCWEICIEFIKWYNTQNK